MNNLNATGRVGKDSEVKYTKDGKSILTFSFAVTDGYGDNEHTDWYNCSYFTTRSEKLAEFVKKGVQLAISGNPKFRKYIAKDGTEKYSPELRINDLTFLGKANVSDSKDNASASVKTSGAMDDLDDLESDLPF
jgi:single-strand DNA-binding protein